jgi:hypothetical protein
VHVDQKAGGDQQIEALLPQLFGSAAPFSPLDTTTTIARELLIFYFKGTVQVSD